MRQSNGLLSFFLYPLLVSFRVSFSLLSSGLEPSVVAVARGLPYTQL